MDPDSSPLSSIFILLALILCNAFFAMSEIAMISLNDNKISKMAREGDKKAAIIKKLIEEPTRFLATIQVGVTLSGFLASAVAADTFAGYIVAALAKTSFPISQSVVRGISIAVITILLSYVTLVLGELVPKRIAMHNHERISFAVARVMQVFSLITRPFVVFLSASANGVLRLLGIDPGAKPEKVTEEEIRMMIDVGGESGTIEQNEKEMLNNIFEFDDRNAADLMTHRTEVTAVELGTPLAEVVQLALESGYSRIPVYENDLDSVLGILYVKDLLGLINKVPPEAFDLRNYVREPLYVLETTGCDSLLGQFQQRKIQMAIVVDEYGGTSGLVSMEDLLEAIVGNIQDEYDDEEEEIAPCGENRFLVDGLTPLADVLKYFSLTLDDEDDYDTIGGFVVSQLGYIPTEGDHPDVILGDVRFSINRMDERRVEQLLAEILTLPSDRSDDLPQLEAAPKQA